MLLNVKQMVGRLIRSEDDRGIVVLGRVAVRQALLPAASARRFPPGSQIVQADPTDLAALLAEVGL